MSNEISYWVPIATAFAGGGFVAIANLITNLINKRSEERKHMHQLLLNAAIEHWKQACTVCLEKMKSGQNAELPPIECTIIYLLKLADTLLNTKLTKNNIKEKLTEIHDLLSEVENFIESQDNKHPTQQGVQVDAGKPRPT
jgi:hypothetical protein